MDSLQATRPDVTRPEAGPGRNGIRDGIVHANVEFGEQGVASA